MTEFFCIGAKRNCPGFLAQERTTLFPRTKEKKTKKQGVLGISIVTWEHVFVSRNGQVCEAGFTGSGARRREGSACGVGGGESRRAKKLVKKKKKNKTERKS